MTPNSRASSARRGCRARRRACLPAACSRTSPDEQRGGHVAAADEGQFHVVSQSEPLLVWARAEDRRADPHHRRAFGDRGLEVVGHPHRQRVEGECRSAQRLEQRAQPHERLALPQRARLPAPESPSGRATAGAAAAPPRARARPPHRRDAALARFAADVDLHAARRVGGSAGGPLRGQALGDVFSRSTSAPSGSACAMWRVLLLWIGPMKCHCRLRVGAALAQRARSSPRLPARSFRRSRACPHRAGRLHRLDAERLADREQADRFAGRDQRLVQRR